MQVDLKVARVQRDVSVQLCFIDMSHRIQCTFIWHLPYLASKIACEANHMSYQILNGQRMGCHDVHE